MNLNLFEPVILTVIQARMGSSRLPGKVLLPLAEKPLIVRMVERVCRAELVGKVIVATTNEPIDDVLVDTCLEEGIEVFRGHSFDLLDRHYQAALKYKANIILKIPSDCPLIDPIIIDKVIIDFLAHIGLLDYASNLHPGTWPDGNDVEVMSIDALEYAWKHANQPHEREHTTPYIYENPSRFQLKNVVFEKGVDYSESHRWTIDYKEDYEFIKSVYDELYHQSPHFGLEDILTLTRNRKDIRSINEKYAGQFWWKKNPVKLQTA